MIEKRCVNCADSNRFCKNNECLKYDGSDRYCNWRPKKEEMSCNTCNHYFSNTNEYDVVFCINCHSMGNHQNHQNNQPKTKEKEMKVSWVKITEDIERGIISQEIFEEKPETECKCSKGESEMDEKVIATMRMMAWEEVQGKIKAMMQTIMDTDDYDELDDMVSCFIESMDEVLFDL